MTKQYYYVFKAFKNNKWHEYSQKYYTLKESLDWLNKYRRIVGYTLQTELRISKIKINENPE